ncbi:DUF2076 domain-containing protein [Blastochloris viridis]|uniref:DUF2076 domain-containing protein n=1 Tax=Blastochloris viridis TaxID=1079 RepID=A0A0H5BPS2_BLAVI|nr:DUF2076 domain-containing protein [Blastochloris viridis]ALK10283.1 hypothetical protein BVIR_2517 [Blastochloris viridis]BAR99783.1 hypothetical protein BV133_2190 [Blastochloris viridis]CUU42945.1 hypothetical protein BVIRIDIS_19610 [Blastochloris viridis]
MSPEEKSVIAGIFDRLSQAENQPRDPDAERFIAERLRTQPYAPYVMAQAIYVQEQALANLSQQVEQLKAEVEELSRRPQQSGGFLSSLFGGGSQPAPQPRADYANAQAPGGQFGRGSVPQAGPQAAGPWGQQPQQGGPMQSRFGGGGGSGFLGTAMTTALGVAGGMMIANAVSSAFSGGQAAKLAEGAGASEAGKDEAAKDTASQDPAAADDSWQSASYDDGGDGGDDFGGGFDDEGFA